MSAPPRFHDQSIAVDPKRSFEDVGTATKGKSKLFKFINLQFFNFTSAALHSPLPAIRSEENSAMHASPQRSCPAEHSTSHSNFRSKFAALKHLSNRKFPGQNVSLRLSNARRNFEDRQAKHSRSSAKNSMSAERSE